MALCLRSFLMVKILPDFDMIMISITLINVQGVRSPKLQRIFRMLGGYHKLKIYIYICIFTIF